MNLADVHSQAIAPALALIGVPDTPQAAVIMLAIGLQESRFEYRRQMGNGPAMGFWQFERGGGVKGVLTHPASKTKAEHLCRSQGVAPVPLDAWATLETNDVLAAGFARLLLLTDPKPLPAVGDADEAWFYYLRNWRPGKPHLRTWAECYAKAMEQVA